MSLAPRSLRAKITLASAVVTGLLLAITALLLVVVQRGQLFQSIDNNLDREAAEVVASLNEQPDLKLGERGSDRFVQILRLDGSVLAGSTEFLSRQAVVAIERADLDEDGLYSFTTSALPIEDDQYRVFVREMQVRGDAAFVIVGENTDDLRDSLWTLMLALAVLVPALTAALAAVSWVMVGRTLLPVAAIQREVSHITGSRLGGRVSVPDTQDEIADLAATMNAMLDRLDHAHQRQQDFVADASHELRSPITRLRTSLEVDLATTTRDLNTTGHELIADLDDLQALVEDLLFLARTGREPQRQPHVVELDAVADRTVGQLEATARVPIDTSGVAAVEVLGNEPHLHRLVTNLLTNALRHAETKVSISTHEQGGMAILVVEDDGPGVDESDRLRIFERFTRLDESRTGSTGGSGLGLAIVKEIATNHGATIDVGTSALGGAMFTLRVPDR